MLLNDENIYRVAVDCGLLDPRDALPEGFVQELVHNLTEFARAVGADHKPLGYVRKEMLDVCKVANNAAALTVVPNPPKSGNWVAIYVDKDVV